MTRTTKVLASADADWRQPPDLQLSPILSNALDAFYENGYHGTSVRDIARRVGLTVPALYYHHENKEALLIELLDRSIERLHELCLQALAAGKDPESRFFNLVECLALFMANSTKIAFLDRDVRALSAKNHTAYSASRRRIQMMVLECIDDGVQLGIFDVTAPGDTARALLGMIQAIATWFRPDGRLSAQEVAQGYVDMAAHLVGADRRIIIRARIRATGTSST